MMHTLALAFEEGGWPMYVNLMMSAIVLAIIGERMFVLFVKGRRIHKDYFVTIVSGLIIEGHYERALKYCDAVGSPLARIVKEGAAPADEVAAAAQQCDEELVRVLGG